MYKYDIGDAIEVYISDDGKAYMPSDLENSVYENIWLVIGLALVLLFIIFDNRKNIFKKGKD